MFDFEDEVKDEFLKALMKSMSDGMVDDVKKARSALSNDALTHAGLESHPDADDKKIGDWESPGVHNQDGDGADEIANALTQEKDDEDAEHDKVDEEEDPRKKVRKFRPNVY